MAKRLSRRKCLLRMGLPLPSKPPLFLLRRAPTAERFAFRPTLADGVYGWQPAKGGSNPAAASRSACLLSLALLLFIAGCAARGTPVPRPFPVPPSPELAGYPGSSVVEAALSLRGAPYRNGGADPSGFDCSGFVQYVLGQNGVAAPRDVVAQFRASSPLKLEAVAPGDLVFFRIGGRSPSHVGIVVTKNTFVHAPSTRGVVRIESLDAAYWRTRFIGARRPAGPPRIE
jgi:hypothetical protein